MKTLIEMKTTFGKAAILALFAIGLSGCGGTKILKEPEPLVRDYPLATISDRQLEVTLDWVIVRGGPGTWAKNADWDEYMLRVHNLSDEPIQIDSLAVTDWLDVRMDPNSSRSDLVKESKEVAKRYEAYDVKVKAGVGTTTMLVGGAAGLATVASIGAAAPLLPAAAAGAAVVTLAAAPVLIVGGVMRGVNNGKVAREIDSRHSDLPIEIMPGEIHPLTAFFPLAPSPSHIEIIYHDSGEQRALVVDTSEALNGLHIEEGVTEKPKRTYAQTRWAHPR